MRHIHVLLLLLSLCQSFIANAEPAEPAAPAAPAAPVAPVEPMPEIDEINLAGMRLQQTYDTSLSKNLPSALEDLYFSTLRMMILDPDRGDPLEGKKAEPAWKMTETVTKDWFNLPSQLPTCALKLESYNHFGKLVDQILEFRKKLQYRAARNIVRSGELSQAYLIVSEDIGKCSMPIEDETLLIRTAQRRYRFEKFGLAIDQFFERYAKAYPEDSELTDSIKARFAKQSGPTGKASIGVEIEAKRDEEHMLGHVKSAIPVVVRNAFKVSSWTIALLFINLFTMVLIYRELRDLTSKTGSVTIPKLKASLTQFKGDSSSGERNSPEAFNDNFKEAFKGDPLTQKGDEARQKMLVDFQNIVDSEEFFNLLVAEANSMTSDRREAYIVDLSRFIDLINAIFIHNDDRTIILNRLHSVLEEIQSSQLPNHYSALEGLVSVICERWKENTLHAKRA